MDRRDKPLLNPFSFPSETKGRFLLLIIAALAFVWNIATGVSEWINEYSYFDLMNRSIDRVSYLLQDVSPTAGDPSGERADPFGSLLAEILLLGWPLVIIPVILLLVAGTVAAVIYLTHSMRIRWRYRTQITAADPNGANIVVEYLRCVSQRIGLVNPPAVLFRSEGKAGGRAFGRKRCETILLDGSSSFWEKSWSAITQSIVLHELAHIKNEDTQDREWVAAIWTAVVVILVATIPLAVTEVGNGQDTPALAGFWLVQLVFLLLRIRLTWGGLLRSRELYADWRVASWGFRDPLNKILQLTESRLPWRGRTWQPLVKLWRLWELHPSHETRRAALADPTILFKVTPDLPLSAGFLVPTLLMNILLPLLFIMYLIFQTASHVKIVLVRVFGVLSPGAELRIRLGLEAAGLLLILLALSAAFLLAAHLTTRALGVQIQRETVVLLDSGDHNDWGYMRLLWPSFLFALGIELALALTPTYITLLSLSSASHFVPNDLFEIVSTFLWLLGFTLLIWLWMAYIRALTRFVIGTHAKRSRPRKVSRYIAWSSSLLVTVLFWPAIVIRWLISMVASQVPYLNGGTGGLSEEMVYYQYLSFPILITAVSVTLFFLWASFSWLTSCYWLISRDASCPACGRRQGFRMIVGRYCETCGPMTQMPKGAIMNVSKLFTFCLAIGSFSWLLLSAHCAGGVLATSDSTLPPEVRVIVDKVGAVPLSLMMFVVYSPPSIFLALVGLGAWFFFIRRPARQHEEAQAAARAREISLQGYFDQVTSTVLDSSSDTANDSIRDIARERALIHEIDGQQRDRLLVFLYETGLTKEPVKPLGNELAETGTPPRIRIGRKVALIITFSLLVFSFIFLLIGMLTSVMALTLDPMMILMGRKTTPGEALHAFTLWLVPAIAAVVSGVGFWWLFKNEQHCRQKEKTALASLKADILRLTMQGIEAVLRRDAPTREDPRLQRLLRARVLSMMPELSHEQKREALEYLYESGLLTGETGLDLTGVDLSSARLKGIRIEDACLAGANLSATDLRGAQLYRTNLSRSNLSDCDLRNAELSSCDLRQVNLSQARLGLTSLRECDLSVANITAEQLRDTASLKGTVMPDGRSL